MYFVYIMESCTILSHLLLTVSKDYQKLQPYNSINDKANHLTRILL